MPVIARMMRGTGSEVLQWAAIPRSRYRIAYADEVPADPWLQTSDGIVFAADEIPAVNVENDHRRPLRVFRVETLGRLPSD